MLDMTSEEFRQFLVYVFCSILVCIDAARRYNTPRTNRSSTTRRSYLASGAGYVLCVLSLYLLLSRVLSLREVLNFIVGPEVTPSALSLPAPLLAALVMTTLLPNVPAVNQIDKQLVAFFHSIGGIPAQVRELQNQLRPERFRLPIDLAELKNFIENDTAIPSMMVEHLRSTGINSDRHRVRFTRNLFLYKQLCDLQGEEGYAAFFEDFNTEWTDLRARFAAFTAQSMTFFTLFNNIAVVVQAGGSVNQDVTDTSEAYRKQCINIFGELTMLLAQALLRSERGPREIRGKVRSIGFDTQEMEIEHISLSVDRIILATLAIFFIAFVIPISFRLLLLSPGPKPAWVTNPHDPLLFPLKITLAYTLAIIIAVLPKQRWNFAKRKTDGQRPYASYFVCGLLALIIGALVNGLIDTGHQLYHSLSPGDVPSFRYISHRIAVLSFALCVSIAFSCDDWPTNSQAEPGWLRWAEGAQCAAVMAATFLLIRAWISLPQESANMRWLFIGLTINVMSGFIVGISIPYFYRRDQRRIGVTAQLGSITGLPDRTAKMA